MIIEKLYLAVVREIAFENQVVGVVGRAFNDSTKRGIRIVV